MTTSTNNLLRGEVLVAYADALALAFRSRSRDGMDLVPVLAVSEDGWAVVVHHRATIRLDTSLNEAVASVCGRLDESEREEEWVRFRADLASSVPACLLLPGDSTPEGVEWAEALVEGAVTEPWVDDVVQAVERWQAAR